MEKNLWIAYNITEKNGKNFWNRVGVAFTNTDGSINVKLESLPINGEIQLRKHVPREERSATRQKGFDDVGTSDIPF